MLNKLPAFSLIEMAMVLIIIGVISGFALPALKEILDHQKARETIQNQEKILYAIASYAHQNKIIPYPADPQNSNGREDKITRRRRGIIPYADLGLPESIAKDGYHRWFTYIIDDYYAVQPPPSPASSVIQPDLSRLCETISHFNSLKIRDKQVHIAFAIISHGPQGRGAYPQSMSPPPLGIDEQQNSISDQEIIDRPFSSDPQRPFSHKVVWVTSRNLLALYGHSPCPSSRELYHTGEAHYETPQHSQ